MTNTQPERILVIPDIHEEWEHAQMILDRYEKESDYTIFLGDYFDSFEYDQSNTDHFIGLLNWLKKTFSSDRRLGIIGNHDVQYFAELQEYCCSGFSPWKIKYIDEILGRNFWKQWKFVHFLNVDDKNYLFSHGGLHYRILPWDFEINEETFEKMNSKIWESISTRTPINYLSAGLVRGGWQNVGGLTWLDFNREFETIPDLRQIVGHTGGSNVRMVGDSICLDTHQRYAGILNTKTGVWNIIDTFTFYEHQQS